ncbi:uncharacterized protein BO96DRAFT_342299 [Aspergillus niger CBS 101883]|uniref:uncharacterized protein n=1 Tax=Aspergillus lacticoffeatus (strain CBS 101883) TaxID=1450533 RepID=UPI000D7EC537|nr:uncharacterized protein BO96DRAFT_342299 [Aspergillus niger CBS 101883]PYH54638.1 hypothetical protein BO96DRAFT_342299 [Aspergillus niger CBS 101883]
MDPNVPGFPSAMQQTAGFPVTPQNPQQFPYYPNAIPPFPQSKGVSHPPQQQHQHTPFGAVPMQAGPSGAMMPSGFPQQSSVVHVRVCANGLTRTHYCATIACRLALLFFVSFVFLAKVRRRRWPQGLAANHPDGLVGPHANFSAPFAQPPVPATSMSQFLPPQATATSTLPATTAQSFPPNMASVSATNMIPAQQQQQRAGPQQNPLSSSAQPAPQSPATAAREKARVSTLLDINSMLLQEVMNLQAAGKAGAPSQGAPESNPSPGSDQTSDKPTQRPSTEYFECMRRLQANLGYLATIADRAKKSGGVPPAAPAIMSPPPNMPSMNEIYNKLNELFPRSAQGGIGTPQQSPQSLQGNGRPSPSPAVEHV